MKQMKKSAVFWGILLAVCIAAGLATRMSYTDYKKDYGALMEKRYDYHIPSEDWWEEISCDGLYESADLIVRGTYTGNRTLANKAFLSEISVAQVYKGPELPDTIGVFEEMEILTNKQAGYLSDEEGNELDKREIILSPSAYYCSYGLMREGAEYLLFLRYKGFHQDSPKRGSGNMDDGSNEYAFVTVPLYSRVYLGNDWRDHVFCSDSAKSVSLGQSESYDIFSDSKEKLDCYEKNVQMIKETIL